MAEEEKYKDKDYLVNPEFEMDRVIMTSRHSSYGGANGKFQRNKCSASCRAH